MMKKTYLFLLLLLFALPVSATKIQFDKAGNMTGSVSNKTAETIANLQGALDQQSANANVRLPNGTTAKVPVSAAANIGRARIAAAAMGCVTSPIGAIVCAASAAAIAKELKDAGVGYGPCPAGSQYSYAFICRADPNVCTTGTCYDYKTTIEAIPGAIASTKKASCQSAIASFNAAAPLGQDYILRFVSLTPSGEPFSDGGTCNMAIETRTGFYLGERIAQPIPVTRTVPIDSALAPASPQEIEQTLQERMDADFQANKRLVDAMKADQAAAQAAGREHDPSLSPIKPDTPVTVSSPPVTTPQKEVSVETIPRSDGSTDTKRVSQETRIIPQVSGSTISNTQIEYKTETTTITNITNSVTNITTTETKVENGDVPAEDKEDYSFSDTSMPPVPELYEQKYPDGLTGVWNAKKPDISSTQFWQGVKQMFPSFGSGSCPSWSMGFNILPSVSLGTHSLTVPCWIFQAIGLIILTTAAFTARKIIF